jgi:hypothetical protein
MQIFTFRFTIDGISGIKVAGFSNEFAGRPERDDSST